MATYHCHITTFSRSKGQSAIASAAYRSGEALRDYHVGLVKHPHRNRTDVEQTFLVGWQGSRENLWNAAEQAEVRKDAQLAREVLVALPAEFCRHEREELTRGLAIWLRSEQGVAVDVAIHRPRGIKSEEETNSNWHAHLLFTTR